jgi:FkbM family methyltransferase
MMDTVAPPHGDYRMATDGHAMSEPWGTYHPNLPVRALVGVSRSPVGRGPLRKGLARLLKVIHSGPVDTTLWGQNVRLHPLNNQCERKALLRPDRMDRREYAFVREKMRGPRSVFVDVGANVGLYSLHAALNAIGAARILAIEPDEMLLSRFWFNVGLAKEAIHPAVKIDAACTAVGDHDGDALLSTDAEEGARSVRHGVGRPVRLRRLIGVLDEHDIHRVTLMKIDIEGCEDLALAPLLKQAPPERWPQSIIIEHVHRGYWASVDVLSLCENLGYRRAGGTNANTLLERL